MTGYAAFLEYCKASGIKLSERNYQSNKWGGHTITIEQRKLPHIINTKCCERVQHCFDDKGKLVRIDIN